MAHHASALKQMRQGVKRRDRNRKNASQLKTQVKKLRAVIAKGDAAAAQDALSETVGEIDRAAKKGVVHDNAAARYKSRLTRKVNALKPRAGLAAGPLPARLQPPPPPAPPASVRPSSTRGRRGQRGQGTPQVLLAPGRARRPSGSRALNAMLGGSPKRAAASPRPGAGLAARRPRGPDAARGAAPPGCARLPPPRRAGLLSSRSRARLRSANASDELVDRLGQPAPQHRRHVLRAEPVGPSLGERLELVQLAHQPPQVLAHALDQLLHRLRARASACAGAARPGRARAAPRP